MIELLRSLASELIENHPFVDNGGCCVVAAQIAKHLEQRNIPNRIVCADWSLTNDGNVNLDDIRPNIDPKNKHDWEENGVGFVHVLVEFDHDGKTYTFDSTDGVLEVDEFWEKSASGNLNRFRLDGHFTVEEATAMANTNSWNPMFDRGQIPIVRRRITRFFNKHILNQETVSA